MTEVKQGKVSFGPVKRDAYLVGTAAVILNGGAISMRRTFHDEATGINKPVGKGLSFDLTTERGRDDAVACAQVIADLAGAQIAE